MCFSGLGGTKFISFEEKHWHSDCFNCYKCSTSLVGRGFLTDFSDGGTSVLCPECGGSELEWRDVEGRGAVYAVSVQYRPGNPMMKDRVPYAVALVDLDAGVRMMSNVVGGDPETVAVGDLVEAGWEPLSDGRHLLIFERTEGN